jgi:tetratricopeptide (TPR) repeat protein
MSVSEVKAELLKLGLSTQTPGLVGDERLGELDRRLNSAREKTNVALGKENSAPSASRTEGDLQGGSSSASAALAELPISEIRSRLTALGENTRTPGLDGEARRTELMKRLVSAIVGSGGNDSDSDGDDDIKEKVGPITNQIIGGITKPKPEPEKKVIIPPPKFVPPPPARPPVKRPLTPEQIQPQHKPDDDNDSDSDDEPIIASPAEISELKKEVTRISNKRAMIIASKLSGSGQDINLKNYEKIVGQTDAELARLGMQKQRSKNPSGEKGSSILIEDGTKMQLLRLISELEQRRSNAKEEIKLIRIQIKEETNLHTEYGINAQDIIQNKLNEAVMSRSRTRRKIDDLKARGEKKEKKKKAAFAASMTEETFTGRIAPGAIIGIGTQQSASAIAIDGIEKSSKKASATAPVSASASASASSQATSSSNAKLKFKPKSKPKSESLSSDRYDSVVERMEAESEKAMAGLDDLLAEMEMEDEEATERFDLDMTTTVTTGRGLGFDEGPDLAIRDNLGIAANNSRLNKSGSVAPRNEIKEVDVEAPAPAPTLEEEEKEEGEEEEEEEEEDDEMETPESDSDSPLKMNVQQQHQRQHEQKQQQHNQLNATPGILNGNRTPRAPDTTPPKDSSILYPLSAQVKASESFATQSDYDSNGQLIKIDPNTYTGDDDDDDDNEKDKKLGVNKNDKAESHSKSLDGLSLSINTHTAKDKTALSVAASGLYDDDEDDEEMAALLLRYPNQNQTHAHAHAHAHKNVPTSQSNERNNVVTKASVVSLNTNKAKKEESSDSDDSNDNDSDEDREEKVIIVKKKEKMQSDRELQPSPFSGSGLHFESAVTAETSIQVSPTTPLRGSDNVADLPNATSIATSVPIEKVKVKEIHIDNSGNSGNSGNSDDEKDEDEDEDDEDAESANKTELNQQITALRRHARVLERLGDLKQAIKMYQKCLELDPLDVKSLQGYAIFLHTKKGELSLAESFFIRAIQVCLPDFFDSNNGNADGNGNGNSDMSPTRQAAMSIKAPKGRPTGTGAGTSAPPVPSENSLRVAMIVRLLTKYADFANKAKGDVEIVLKLYRKAIELSPNHSDCIAKLGHFLSEEGDEKSLNESLLLFSKAMKLSPNNGQYALWYARVLKKTGKLSQAEIMYQVACKNSKNSKEKVEKTDKDGDNGGGGGGGDDKNYQLEPSALCNYATFIYRQRKNVNKAKVMFVDALLEYPTHKGLIRNYTMLLKANPHLANDDDMIFMNSSRSPMKPGKSKSKSKSKSTGGEGGGDGGGDGGGGGGGNKSSNKGPISESSNPTPTPTPVNINIPKRQVAKVNARLMLSTSGGRLDADTIISKEETPLILKQDYVASLKNLHGSGICMKPSSWPQTDKDEDEEEEKEKKKHMKADLTELIQSDLAEFSNRFDGVFDTTAANTAGNTAVNTENNTINGEYEEAGIYKDDAASDSDTISSDSDDSTDDDADADDNGKLYKIGGI